MKSTFTLEIESESPVDLDVYRDHVSIGARHSDDIVVTILFAAHNGDTSFHADCHVGIPDSSKFTPLDENGQKVSLIEFRNPETGRSLIAPHDTPYVVLPAA